MPNIGDHTLYNVWRKMRHRCQNPYHHKYESYGGRGIRVHEAWSDSFRQWLADMPPRPTPQHTLDRIDVNGHYEPGNVRWATAKEQQRNRRDNVLATIGSETKLVSVWATEFGVNPQTVMQRVKKGWNIHAALYHPQGVWTNAIARRCAQSWAECCPKHFNQYQ